MDRLRGACVGSAGLGKRVATIGFGGDDLEMGRVRVGADRELRCVIAANEEAIIALDRWLQKAGDTSAISFVAVIAKDRPGIESSHVANRIRNPGLERWRIEKILDRGTGDAAPIFEFQESRA